MKKLILLSMILSVVIVGCNRRDNPPPPPAGSVTVKGNIKNESLAWQNYIPNLIKKAFAADFISTRSTLTVTDPERYADVSKSIGIVVEADVINSTPSKIENYKVDIFIEDEQKLTPEVWTCNVCYNTTDGGESCQATNEFQGDKLFEPDNITSAPACQAGLGQQDLCVTIFPANINCGDTPTYTESYTEAGNGLDEQTIDGITVEALSNAINGYSIQSGGWLTGTDKYARFIVYNEVSVEVFRKDYVFNVIP